MDKVILSKNSMRQLIIFLAIFFVDVLLLLACPNLTIAKTMVYTGAFATVTLILTGVLLYNLTKEINFFLLFIIIAYVFEFGQSMATWLGGYDCLNPAWFLNINNGYFSSQEIWNSFYFSHMIMMCLIVGYILFYRRTYPNKKSNSVLMAKKECINKQQIQIGYFLLLLSIIPTFYLLKEDMTTIRTLGYGATLQAARGGIQKIFSLISELFPVSIIWLLIFDNRKRSQLFVLGIAALYMVLQLAGGSRIQVFRFALVIFLILSLYYKKITKKNMLLLILLALVGVFAMSLISSIRTSIYVSTDLQGLIKNAVISLWENNFIIEALKEMGNTQLINALVIKKCPQEVDLAFGASYLRMLISVVPNIWGGVHPSSIDVDSVFSPLYTNLCGLGSSFIAEAYWNFGFFSVLFCVILGMLFAVHNRKLQKVCENGENKTKIYLGFYTSFLLIFWVRSSCNGMGRSMVYAMVPIILNRIIMAKTVRGGVRQAKEWLVYICSYVNDIPQKLCNAVSLCYLFEREVAV